MSQDAELLQRRELLRRAAWLLGGAVSAPAALAILQGCSAKDPAAGAAATLKVLSPAQLDVVSSLRNFHRARHRLPGWARWRTRHTLESSYEALLARVSPELHPGFLQPWLDLVIRKPAADPARGQEPRGS